MIKTAIQLILIIAGVVMLIWFLIPFFTNRILNIGNITGIFVSLVLLLYGIFFSHVNHFIVSLWKWPFGKIIEIILGSAILAILVLAVMTSVCMLKALQEKEAQAGHPQPKTIIILGCKVKGTVPSLMLTERLEAALSYLETSPDSNIIVTGGQGKDELITEADAMYNWLVANGVSSDKILKEDRSTDTQENLKYSMDIINSLDGIKWTSDVVIVTNDFHEYRALKIAEKTGFSASPCPAKTAWWLFPAYYVREMYGILEYWFLADNV